MRGVRLQAESWPRCSVYLRYWNHSVLARLEQNLNAQTDDIDRYGTCPKGAIAGEDAAGRKAAIARCTTLVSARVVDGA